MEESISKAIISEEIASEEITDKATKGRLTAYEKIFVNKLDSSIEFTQNLTQDIWNGLGLHTMNPRQFSPLVLAYIGDSIYDLVIRTYLLDQGNMPVNKINKHACRLVKAETQSKIIGFIEEKMTDEELSVYKRGRNAKSYTSAKNATIGDYRRATGFEALMGYLYLSGNYERMMQLIREGLEQLGELKEK